MFNQYLQQLNIVALAASGVLYWALGMLWYSVLFGKAWKTALASTGLNLENPEKKEMAGMMIGSLLYNYLTVFAVSYLVFITGCVNLAAAVKMGGLLGACIAWTSIGTVYTWEKRSLKHLAIDGGYHVFGITMCSVILALWR